MKRMILWQRWRVLAVLVLVGGSFILAGCQGGRGSSGLGLPEVYTGTEGVDAYFSPGSVPSRTVSGSSTDLLLLVSNRGAVDSSQMTIVVRDSRGYFDFNRPILKVGENGVAFQDGGVVLKGRAATGNVGSLESFPVSAVAKGFLKNEEAKESGFLAEVCYKYETRLTANVCIDTSPTYSETFQKERKACLMDKPVLLDSQGAPVAVKKIEAAKVVANAKTGNVKVVRPRFTIYLSNVGNGDVIDGSDPHSYCVPSKGKAYDPGMVKVESASFMGLKLSCDEKKQLTDILKNDFIVCEYEGDEIREGVGAFATPLSLVLSYGYSSTSSPVPIRIDAARIKCGDGKCDYPSETCQSCEADCGSCGSGGSDD